MNFVFILNSILLGIGLSMDAFSISLANGLNDSKMSLRKMNLISGCYGFFQFAMPLIGWLCVHTIIVYFKKFELFIPWIALILLSFIGGKMIFETRKSINESKEKIKTLSFAVLIIQGIATSIDALSVGFTIAEYDLLMAFLSSLIIGIVTFILCFLGLKIGKKVGTKFSNKASILGGIILIVIGIEIFVKGVFF